MVVLCVLVFLVCSCVFWCVLVCFCMFNCSRFVISRHNPVKYNGSGKNVLCVNKVLRAKIPATGPHRVPFVTCQDG